MVKYLCRLAPMPQLAAAGCAGLCRHILQNVHAFIYLDIRPRTVFSAAMAS